MLDFNVNILLNLVLGMIMFGLGLSLTTQDFRNLFKQPGALAVGLFSQMILLPIVALLIAEKADLSPELKVGVMILSVCPGGITSNLISYFVKGNVALSISLTVSNALLSLISIPLLVNAFLWHFLDHGQSISLPFWESMFEIFIVTVLPATLGFLMNFKFPGLAKKAEKPLNYVLPVLLILVFALKFLGDEKSGGSAISKEDIFILTPYVILLNAVSMLLGFIAGKLFSLNFQNRLTISIEVGLHNTALALVIAGELLKNSTMEKPALVYALYSFVITFLIAWGFMKARNFWAKKSSLH